VPAAAHFVFAAFLWFFRRPTSPPTERVFRK